MKIKPPWFLLAFIFLLALAACAGGTAVADPPVETAAETLSLGPSVDVQTVDEIRQRDDVYLIDVREQYEYDEAHIPNITLIPLGQVPDRISEIPTDKTVILTCRSGNRSGQATDFLRQQGFDNVHNMEGGIVAWQAAGLPVE